jgi:hypothetical protein
MAAEVGYASTGIAPRIKAIHAVALYDAKGRIHHMHHVVMLEGGNSVDADTATREAAIHAERMGRDVRKLKALYVTSLPNPRAMHRVDVRRQVLVELEPPPVAGRRRTVRPRGSRLS